MPCRRLDVVSLSDPKVLAALTTFEKLRIDTGEQPDVAEKHSINSIPVLIAFGPDGKELVRKNGYQDPAAVLAFLEEAKGKLAK